MPQPTSPNDGPKLTGMGVLVILLVIGGSLYGAYALFKGGRPGTAAPGDPGTAPAPGGQRDPAPAAGAKVAIGVAYGTEKKRWMEAAAEQFAQTPEGRSVAVNLLGMGSLEAAQAVLRGDQAIHVWSPASSLYRGNLEEGWKAEHNGRSPIAKEEILALTPMVFVVWDERAEAFERSLGPMSFQSVAKALATPGGWNDLAQKPEWGLFKFGHTHPNQSNSGLATLVLMACDFRNKPRGLSLADITDAGFAKWTGDFERAVTGLSNSTGNMMRDMVLKGPSTYDALFVYESVAIDYLKNAEGRWGKLRVVYPRLNLWNENPYYVLDVPWSSPEQRRAADAFLRFLMSEPVQRQSLTHGFRPGNPAVPVKFPESPFVAYQSAGLRADLPGTICDPPPPEVIQNLLLAWQRAAGGR